MWNLLNYINIVLSGEERLFADDKFVAVDVRIVSQNNIDDMYAKSTLSV